MSETARQLFEGIRREAGRAASEIGAEIGRLNTLAPSELAAALFKGDAFVMYGPGQRAANVEQEHSVFGPSAPLPEHDHERDREIEMER